MDKIGSELKIVKTGNEFSQVFLFSLLQNMFEISIKYSANFEDFRKVKENVIYP